MSNRAPKPPRWAEAFFDFYCHPRYKEEIKGDLYELFEDRCAHDSVRLASLRFVWEVVRFFRWRYLRKSANLSPQLQQFMVRNYLKISLRTLKKQRLHAFINIGGLSLGLAACALILLYVRYEYSFDHFHEKADRLYVAQVQQIRGPEYQADTAWWSEAPEDLRIGTILPMPMANAMKEQVPGVARVAAYSGFDGMFTMGDQTRLEDFYFTTEDFLDMFSFPLLSGDPRVLHQPNQLVLTKSKAEAWFGNADPIGQEVLMNLWGEEVPMEVGAVIADPPGNSTLDFTLLVPMQQRPNYERMLTQWGAWQTELFVELEPGIDPASTKDAFRGIVKTHLYDDDPSLREKAGLSEDQMAMTVGLLPILDIHVNPFNPHWSSTHPRYLVLLSVIAFVILLIASINYISLSLARSAGRNLEVGIRKSMGATVRGIVGQFYVETALVSVIALVLAVVLGILVLPGFSGLAQRDFSARQLLQPQMLLTLGGLLFLTTLVAGSYPAGYFARFRTAQVLKGRSIYNVRSGFLRGLVIVQFTLSSALLVGALGIYQQMDFILNKDLGFNADQVIRVTNYMGEEMAESEARVQKMTDALASSTAIKSVSGISNSFGRGWSSYSFSLPDEDNVNVYCYRMAPGFVETLDLKLLEGTSIDQNANPANKWVVNESFVETFGLNNPVGTQMPWSNDGEEMYEIVGVVQNFNFLSLDRESGPALIHFNPELDGVYNLLVRADGGQIRDAVVDVEEAWKDVAEGMPFDFSFLRDDIQGQYEEADQLKQLLGYATALALIVAILGLFGLSGIQALNRTKEIGVRKVLGARVVDIFLLLNRQTLVLCLVALVVGVPLAAWLLQDWLETFAYHISLGWEFFLPLAIGLITLVALTVSYYALRAASTSPASALRDE